MPRTIVLLTTIFAYTNLQSLFWSSEYPRNTEIAHYSNGLNVALHFIDFLADSVAGSLYSR